MKIFITIFGFILFVKCFFFWLWLWQLKEYHWGRFRAHFEGRWFKKIISSFWRLKFPKFTKKIIVISASGILLAILIIYFIFSLPNADFYLAFLAFIFSVPLFSSLLVLLFQIPTEILRNRILQKAKRKKERFKNLLVIGITGSYGKTSTKEFLHTILVEKFGENKVLKTKKHQNSEMGISQSILQELKPEHEIFIVEMGAYNRGGIKLLCDIARPKIGIITGVNEQHLATFGTMENLLSAEGGQELIESLPRSGSESSLLRGLPEDGIVFLSGKNEYCQKLYQKIKIEKYLYGQEAPLLAENLEGAKLVAQKLGMTEEEIYQAVEKIKNKLPGIELKKGRNGLNIIDATYSANPDGVMAHLEYLKTFPGKKVIIMPCLIELGKASKEVHKRIGRKIKEVCDLAIITTKDRLKEIKEGAVERGMREESILLIENPQEIFERIKNFNQPDDVILLEGRVPSNLIKLLTC